MTQPLDLIFGALEKYFRLEIIGADNIPRGPALLTPNHSGFLALDAMMLAHQLRKLNSIPPVVLTHFLWFSLGPIAQFVEDFGFIEATKANGISALEQGKWVVLFPEGENGNFKPTTKAYRLQEFRRGFLRMALATQAPIVPTLIIGAEETHLNLSQFRLPKPFKNLLFPIPLNIVPLPARWKIVFLKPIDLPVGSDFANDDGWIHETCQDIRELMQAALTKEIQNRKSIYF